MSKPVKCPTCPVMMGPETVATDHDQGCKLVISAREGARAMHEERTTPWSEVKRELGMEDNRG